jgi:hypothetical protein
MQLRFMDAAIEIVSRQAVLLNSDRTPLGPGRLVAAFTFSED